MNRLTKRTKGGIAYTEIPLNQSTVLDEKGNIIGCRTGFIADRLAAYEDTGLQPEHIDSIIEQLLGYLDAEQAGLLIELPCKVGDKVYVNSRTFGTYDDIEYAEAEVVSIRITKKQTFVKLRIFALGLDGMPYGCSNYPVSSFGKTVFLTREEAEKALEVE